jgi:hypothetical protein
MKRHAFWLSSSVSALAGIVIACSGSTTDTTPGGSVPDAAGADADDDAEAVTPADAGGGTCELPQGLTSGRKTCDDCLLKSCCVAINTCTNDAKCSKMNDCYGGCYRKFGVTDAGADCVKTCVESGDQATAEKLNDMLDCQVQRCGTVCKG